MHRLLHWKAHNATPKRIVAQPCTKQRQREEKTKTTAPTLFPLTPSSRTTDAPSLHSTSPLKTCGTQRLAASPYLCASRVEKKQTKRTQKTLDNYTRNTHENKEEHGQALMAEKHGSAGRRRHELGFRKILRELWGTYGNAGGNRRT